MKSDRSGDAAARRQDPRLPAALEFQSSGRLAEADALLDRILADNAEDPEALNMKGVVAAQAGNTLLAWEWMTRAVEVDRRNPHYLRNLTETCRRLGKLDLAVDYGRRAAAITPDDSEVHYNLAMVHYERGEMDRAIVAARRAIGLNPEHAGAHFELAECLLLTGRLPEGWKEYEWRWRIPGVAQPLMIEGVPEWDGSPLPEGRIMLVGDQGFGDVLQFARYVPQVASRCSEVIVAASAELAALMQTLPGSPKVVTVTRDLPQLAAQTTMSSLPGLLGTTVETIPGECPYLTPPESLVAQWGRRFAAVCPAGYRKIGLAWAGRPEHGNDRNRSISLTDLAPIGGLEGVALVSLQKGQGTAGLGEVFWRAPVFNVGHEFDAFIDTAAAITHLDLVVTVDTAIAHLAGALGKPCWIMLPYAPDWRWLQERTDTPWYPNTRLFRQPAYGDWKTVIADVTKALADSLPARPPVMVAAD